MIQRLLILMQYLSEITQNEIYYYVLETKLNNALTNSAHFPLPLFTILYLTDKETNINNITLFCKKEKGSLYY